MGATWDIIGSPFLFSLLQLQVTVLMHYVTLTETPPISLWAKLCPVHAASLLTDTEAQWEQGDIVRANRTLHGAQGRRRPASRRLNAKKRANYRGAQRSTAPGSEAGNGDQIPEL